MSYLLGGVERLRLGGCIAAVLCLASCEKLTPSGDETAGRGIRHYEQQQYQDAINQLELSIERGLNKVALDDVCTVIGNCHNELENFPEAIRWHQRAIEANPKAFKAWVNMGIVHRLSGDFDAAEKCYQQALELNPDYAELHASLGALYVFRDEPQKAVVSLEKAVRLDNKLGVAHANLALAYAMNNRFDDAHRALKAAILRGYENGDVIGERIAALEAAAP
jgi:tetratricopeptide (TPR) repeat protein